MSKVATLVSLDLTSHLFHGIRGSEQRSSYDWLEPLTIKDKASWHLEISFFSMDSDLIGKWSIPKSELFPMLLVGAFS